MAKAKPTLSRSDLYRIGTEMARHGYGGVLTEPLPADMQDALRRLDLFAKSVIIKREVA